MKRKLTENIPLKIMSVAVAILVWLLVVNIDNPIVTRPYTVTNVELINNQYVEDDGKMPLREKDQESVRVMITGKRKTLDKIRESDIHAAADLQQAVSLDTDPVMVPIVATLPNYPTILQEYIKVTPQNLSVHLEEKETQEFPVNVNLGDSKPGKGYEIGTRTIYPEKIKITGPKSLVNKIDKVNVDISREVEGKTQDIAGEYSLTIFDKNEEVLLDSEMNNLRIDNNGKVNVTIKLWKVRTDVKIVAVGYQGEPAEGYMVDSINTVPETVSVAGTEEALEELRKIDNSIWIPQENIDISGRDTDKEIKINLTDMLSEGLKLTSNTSEDVWVKVNILPVGSHAYELATNEIKVKNPPDDLQVTFDSAKIEVRVKAADGSLEDFDENKIKASIDLEDKEVGSYEVPVDIILPKGYELVGDVYTDVKISEVSSVAEESEK